MPLKIDYTDLYDLMAFFAGDIDGKGGHDDLAKQIAYAGRDWTQKHWRWEDMETYAFRLYLEWARVAAADQEHVDYIGRLLNHTLIRVTKMLIHRTGTQYQKIRLMNHCTYIELACKSIASQQG